MPVHQSLGPKTKPSLSSLFVPFFLTVYTGCSSTPKNSDQPILLRYQGKKIALVEVSGESTEQKIVEVALINQLKNRGSFIIVSKQDVEKSRARPEQDPRDWKGIAKGAGAEVALRIRVLKFDAAIHEGYSREDHYDSLLAKERGEKEGTTKRLYKVKSLVGLVRYELLFADLGDEDLLDDQVSSEGIAEASDKVVKDNRNGAIRLPGKLRFLEQLSNKAFKQYFDQNS